MAKPKLSTEFLAHERKALRVKCAQEGITISLAVRSLLFAWIRGEIELPDYRDLEQPLKQSLFDEGEKK